ncbi:hypothetical protein GQ44DRAFT_696656 [Phaeosphaeriaceae sp. PMI808]|nr:hypothetical protein GQ44DRAFT_696656 [Phaeosphaeriaceae sp. PMI808]
MAHGRHSYSSPASWYFFPLTTFTLVLLFLDTFTLHSFIKSACCPSQVDSFLPSFNSLLPSLFLTLPGRLSTPFLYPPCWHILALTPRSSYQPL